MAKKVSAKKTSPEWGILAACVLLCEGVGLLGAYFTAPSVASWYVTLNKPWFTPPGWLFGPVWTILYLLMGIALYRIWHLGPKKSGVKSAVAIFLAQLALNFSWSFIFFGLHNISAALIIILALWLFITSTIVVFQKLDKLAAQLLYPYIMWVSFASLLNAALWLLNS